MNSSEAISRAESALCSTRFDVDLLDPFAASILRARRECGASVDAEALLHRWERFHPGSPIGETRYRWALNHAHIPVPDYASASTEWRPWRLLEEQLRLDPYKLEARLSLPISMTECGELLLELSARGELSERAQALFDGCEPVFRRDFASYVRAFNPFEDTFALWCLCRCPRMFEVLRHLAYAIATGYASIVRHGDGPVLGRGFPFHEKPLVSATAQLTKALFALGTDLDLASQLIAWLFEQQSPEGGYHDPEGPDDLLTTLVTADLLCEVDPAFEPAASRDFALDRQNADGTWAEVGPERPWLTAAIVGWLKKQERPFCDRFSWPTVSRAHRDRKTGLPGYAWFGELVAMFESLKGLGDAPVDVAFIDLAKFKAFNDALGQGAGDAALAAFGRALGTIPRSVAIRDGGDEFLVVGAPTSKGLAEKLNAFRQQWPARFREQFSGAPVVVPRIVVGTSTGGGLSNAREELGRHIGTLKDRNVPESGLLEELSL